MTMAQLERRRLNDEQPGQLLKQPEQTEQKPATQEVTSQQVASPHVMETYRRMHGGIKPQQQQTVTPPTAPKVPDNLKVKKAERKAQSQVTPDEGFYTKLFKEENARIKPLTDKELEQQAKKQKREKIFAAIGDGISALSNLYFTTQYAPNVEQKPMSDKVKERWDKLEAERKGKEKAWYEGYVNALKLDDAKAAQLRKEKADKDAYDLRVKEYQRKVAKDEADAEKRRNETQKEQYLAEQERIEKEYMERTGMKMPTTKVGGGSSSSGGNKGTNPIYAIKDGKVVVVGYTKSYDSAVAESRRNGVNIKKVRKKNKDIMDTTETSELTTQIEVPDGKGGWKAIEVSAESTADNTPPSKQKSKGKTNDNNDNRPPSRR